ncbi:hypothetical protein HRK28_04565 [Rathayibacter sp. VKM Ac-2835]|uniref:hypothetical protein n=1 Tax=Rathayibacter sp. VKM Ac-2835 TaxID=2739043 RepID=UPI001566CC7E|nr:hypothetical protein [Rathayibacter sp. VKM Ac-2835]NRG40187.1 hypothetical protein [Rathayibacter sp. VKM Ac-2835]
MPRLPSTLTENQVAILQWIADGAPADRYPSGFAHRITARALASRGYVSIEGRGDGWRATITADGIKRLEDIPTPTSPPASPEGDALYARVLAADGLLELEPGADEASRARVVSEYNDSPTRLPGSKLVFHETSWFSAIASIEIVGVFDEVVPHAYVAVSDDLRVTHPLARAFLRSNYDNLVTPAHAHRAARILQALIREALRRGWEVLEHGEAEEWRTSSTRVTYASFDIKTAEARYAVLVREMSAAGGEQVPFAQRHRGPAWRIGRSTEFISTGRLEVRLFGWLLDRDGTPFRESKRPLKPIGLALDELMRTIVMTDMQLVERRRREERERARRRARWESVRAEAVERFREAKHREALVEQSEKWTRAQQLRAYAAAGELALPDDARDALREWFKSAARQADAIDPLRSLSRIVPTFKEPTPEDLRPFMRGLSPHPPSD